MKKYTYVRLVGLTMMILSTSACFTQKKIASGQEYPIQPVLFTDVKMEDNFWQPRIKTNHEVTIPFTMGKLYETGRIKNFEIAAGHETGAFCTQFTFDDTDLYKIIEGACYSFQIFDDPTLEAKVDSLIALIGEAQEDDGYIFTNRTIMGENGHEWSGKERWEKVEDLSHELYNIGHLIEAAVAHHYATGKDNFLNIAIKAADRVCEDFGPGKIERYPGHQIIELAMAKLYHVTGKQKYLDTGKFFLDVRGPGGDAYNQAHLKLVDQHEAVGHAVRAAYMYAGMADIAALTNDQDYARAIDDIWEDVVNKKIYVTGGIGATGHGEAFGKPYELPNMSAYCETCASIANVYWNYRLFLRHGDAKYYDVLERTLYNAFLSGVGMDGKSFFYPNPLESHGQHGRSPWFNCACCPGNVARFVPSVSGYFCAQDDDQLYVNLYGQNTSEFTVKGKKVQLHQVTEFPWDGKINVEVNPQQTQEFGLRLRIPGWAIEQPMPGDLYTFEQKSPASVTASLNGSPIDIKLDKGYLVLQRKWKKGDVVELNLPIDARRLKAREEVVDDRSKTAIQRGPLMYCAEWPDNKDGKVLNLVLPESSKMTETYEKDLLNGVYVLDGSGVSAERGENNQIKTTPTNVRMIPYYAWAHRGSGEMMVWVPEDNSVAKPLPAPTIASKSKISASYRTKSLMALNDQMEAKNSNDHSIIYYHWWPKQDTLQYVQYDFAEAAAISSSKVYWYDDGPFGGCRIPAAWRLLYRKGDEWLPVKTNAAYPISKDEYNEISFEKVTTDGLRLEVMLPKTHSAGIMEWMVE